MENEEAVFCEECDTPAKEPEKELTFCVKCDKLMCVGCQEKHVCKPRGFATADQAVEELQGALEEFLKVVDAGDAEKFGMARGRAYAAVLDAQKYREEHAPRVDPSDTYSFGDKTFTVGDHVRMTEEQAKLRSGCTTGVITGFGNGKKGRQKPPFNSIRVLKDDCVTPQTWSPNYWEKDCTK
jgi:hypothetical protein